MHAVMRRLQSGERWWAAEVAFRLAGLVLLELDAISFRRLEQWVTRPPAHAATGPEFALSCLVVVFFSSALACLIEGPGLFRLIPHQRRRLF